MKGKLDGGELTGLFEAKNNIGSALVSTQFKLAGADLRPAAGRQRADRQRRCHGVAFGDRQVGRGAVRLAVGLGNGGVKGAQLPGINPGRFPGDPGRRRQVRTRHRRDPHRRLCAGDRVGRHASPRRRPTSPSPWRPACCAPRRSRSIRQAAVSADLKADFTTGVVGASGSVTYAPGDDALVGSEPSVGFTVQGPLAALSSHYDTEPLAQFLTQRALEREQARVEALQSSSDRKATAAPRGPLLRIAAVRARQAAEALRKAEEEARQAAEERRKAEEEAQARRKRPGARPRRQAQGGRAAQAQGRRGCQGGRRQTRCRQAEAGASARPTRRAGARRGGRSQGQAEERQGKGRRGSQAQGREATRIAEEERSKADALPGVRAQQLPAAQEAPQAEETRGRRFDPLRRSANS